MKRLLLVFSLACFGCATTYKNQLYQTMAIGAAVGAIYGMSKPENRDAYALMWSGVGADAGALAYTSFKDPEAETEKLRSENKRLQSQMDALVNPRIESQTTAFFGSRVPDKYKALINPGEWRVSKIDQWIEEDENRLVHQDQVMELVPPSLNPVSFPNSKEKP